MKKGIIGRKLGMTQLFDEKGKVVPVTVINAGPCVVVQKRTNEKNGYEAVQLGFSDIPERKLNKPEKGVFAKAEVSFKKYLKEFRLDDCASLNVGDVVTADTFEAGEKVAEPKASFARIIEASNGKDTTIGHWEISGVERESKK